MTLYITVLQYHQGFGFLEFVRYIEVVAENLPIEVRYIGFYLSHHQEFMNIFMNPWYSIIHRKISY